MKSYAKTFQIVCTLVLVLAWVTMALRYVARLFIMRIFKLDCLLASASLVLCTASCSCALARLNSRSGITEFHAAFIAFELLYVFSTGLIKISFCLTILPILNKPLYKKITYAAGALVGLYSVFYFSWSLAKCGQPSAIARCLGGLIIPSYVHAAILIGTDLVLATLCLIIVYNLHMKMLAKTSVALLLLMGSSPFVATIFRTYYASTMEDPVANLNKTILFGMTTVIEMGFCIIAVSATTLRPLFVKLKLISSYREASEPNGDTKRCNSRQSTQRLNEGDIFDFLPEDERGIYVTRSFVMESAKLDGRSASVQDIDRSV